ncbi:MAG: hypothetical protein KatS3mg035_1087 [Bacteroidia bacterium]|nr:MAG: hypothetical protein KatS3mg035_1087 [Bacteroidia bacterium]
MKYDEFFNVNDTYKIKQDIAQLKALIEEVEEDINAFLSHKKVKYKGVRARKRLGSIKNEFIPNIQRKILKTKQDYDSDYS